MFRALMACVFFLVSIATAVQSQNCDWRVSGVLQVNHELWRMSRLVGETQRLEGVEVRIKAQSRVGPAWGTWSTWGTVRTNENGYWEIHKSRGCGKRRFQVDVRFKDAELELRHATSTSSPTKVTWYPVHNDALAGTEQTRPIVNLPWVTFGPGQSGLPGNFEPYRHAQLWAIYKLMIGHLKSYGSNFEIGRKLVVKYPHNSQIVGSAEASYANPITRIVYIHRDANDDDFEIDTLFHEAFHIWAYTHSGASNCLTMDLITTFDTHDLAPNSCSAFHEGFAEFAARELMTEIFDSPRTRPSNRAGIAGGRLGIPLPTVALAQRLDNGWENFFRVLTLNDLQFWDFGTSNEAQGAASPITATILVGSCSSARLGLKQVLRVFMSNSRRGLSSNLDRDDMTFDGFLTRAQSALPNRINETEALAVFHSVNPESGLSPAFILCDTTNPTARTLRRPTD